MRQDSKLLLLNKVSIQSNECVDKCWFENKSVFLHLFFNVLFYEFDELFFFKLKPSYNSWDE